MAKFAWDATSEREIERLEREHAKANPPPLLGAVGVTIGDTPTLCRDINAYIRSCLRERKKEIAVVVRSIVHPKPQVWSSLPEPAPEQDSHSVETPAAPRPGAPPDPYAYLSRLSLAALHARGCEDMPLMERRALEAEINRRNRQGPPKISAEEHEALWRAYGPARGDWH